MSEEMISETEMDEGLTAELVPANEIKTLAKGLPPQKIEILVRRFSDLFDFAAQWAKKAKTIIVTSGEQKETIKVAREGRLTLRQKRLEIENIRKLLKEDALREGQAIDKIAGFLKDMIIPTEEHLDRQEHFVEYKQKAEEQAKRIEIEKRMAEEAERQAKEKAEENARLRTENERLAKEQVEKDRIATERIKAEQEKAKRAEEELRQKKQQEMKAEAERLKEHERLAAGGDITMMEHLYKQIDGIKIPQFKSAEAKRIMGDCEGFIATMKLRIKQFLDKQVQEEE